MQDYNGFSQLGFHIDDPWVIYDTKLPKTFCDEISEHYYSISAKKGKTLGGVDRKVRDVDCRWSTPNDWVSSFIWNYVNTVNQERFRYDLCGMYYTECHHLEYHPGHFYNWHEDTDHPVIVMDTPKVNSFSAAGLTEYTRKLSFILQLSEESDYDGGDVQLLASNNTYMFTLPKDRGTLCVFDSRTRHRVKAVKSGIRNVLVGWAVGPRWR